jgi:ketosteroid isomerase-like protein
MRVVLLLVVLGICAVAQGQSALQDMVRTEQAFSKMAEEKNARDAFMAFIADDGLLFRPGAVNGKKWMLEHPVPPSDKKPLLAWQPAFAGMSASGDLGFTTGPWEFKGDIKDQTPSGYGHFVTVWKKQPDGSWKFVADLGIGHPQSGGPQTLWQPAEKTEKTTAKSVEAAGAVKGLLDRDRAFSVATLDQGLVKSYSAFASPELRLYRNGNLPFIGREASTGSLSSVKGQFKSEPINAEVSRAGDLGYTHGTYEITGGAKKVVEHGSYLRIWRKQGGVWQVVLDVTNAHQE